MNIKRTLTLYHEIFNIPQWLPPNVKTDIKLQFTRYNFILQSVVSTARDEIDSLTSAILYVRKQQVMSSVALAIETLRVS